MNNKEVYDKTNGRCWYCGIELKEITRIEDKYGNMISKIEPDNFVIDHIVPRFYGGSSDIDNLVPCCWKCNSTKRTFDIEKFRFRQMLKLNGVPRFSDEQVRYLYSMGFYFNLTRYEFYFEKMGLI